MPNEIYARWFKKAEEDELSVRAIFRGEGFPGTVCFLAQQMTEKYLKGFLTFQRKSFPKTHDLLELLTLALPSQPEAKDLHGVLMIYKKSSDKFCHSCVFFATTNIGCTQEGHREKFLLRSLNNLI
ncbi:MAG: HEPN domain-containing protein [Nitrospirae bacterium]|nr:HEPN domain-containing protein [Nitrospirota bacterium]